MMTDDKLAVTQEAARRALAMIEVARTGVTNPVNGGAPYSWVTFAGATIRFDQTDFSKYHNGTVVYDAATDKAAAQAQGINDLLMTVAMQAASYAIAQARLAGERAGKWQDIASAPVDEPILAAVQVVNNKSGAEWWERHVIVIDSETGNVMHDTDAGWSAGDYTHWRPLPEPPAILKEAASITQTATPEPSNG